MLSGRKISKGGIVGALIGIVLSLFSHKSADSNSKKIVKTGAFGLGGFLIGSFAEKKFRERR